MSVSFVARFHSPNRTTAREHNGCTFTHSRELVKKTRRGDKNVRLLVRCFTHPYVDKLQQSKHTRMFLYCFVCLSQSHSNNLRFIFRSGNGGFCALTAQLLIGRLSSPFFSSSLNLFGKLLLEWKSFLMG